LLTEWLALSWQPIQRLRDEWTVDDLFQTNPLAEYVVSRQWTIWRIMSQTLITADKWPRCWHFKASMRAN
jgi:hypothetical protein